MGKYALVLERLLVLANKKHRTKLSHVNLLLLDYYKIARAEEAVAAGKKPPSLQTIHDEITIIKTFMNFCLRRKLIATDPLAGLDNPEPPSTEQPWWTWDQVMTILNSCSELIRPPLTLLAYTGMRFGEMQHLTWEDIDYQNNVIRIRPKEGWQPKSKDQRAVPMSAELRAMLQTLTKISHWVFTMPLTKHRLETGKQWTEKRLLERLKVVLKKLGLKGHLHTFRHSFISYSISERESEAQIRAWVGHVDAEILKHYTHIHDQQSQDAMGRLMNKSIQRPQEGGDGMKSA
jgi:integrase